MKHPAEAHKAGVEMVIASKLLKAKVRIAPALDSSSPMTTFTWREVHILLEGKASPQLWHQLYILKRSFPDAHVTELKSRPGGQAMQTARGGAQP